MEIKWIHLNPDKISGEEILEFRNRVIQHEGAASQVEIEALERQIVESAKDGTQYNLVALKNENIVAWASGIFSKVRLTDMIRMLFFDTDILGEQGVDNLLYQLEFALPYPYKRIEIYGLGPHRERDLELVMRSGYRQGYDIAHYQWVKGAKTGPGSKLNLNIKNEISPEVGFEIYKSAFKQLWDRDEVSFEEFEFVLNSSDIRLSFTAFQDETPVGIVVVNEGLDEGDAYLQIIAAGEKAKGDRIGDAMMMNLMSLMMSHDIRSLSLATYADNEAMKKLLKRWYFTAQFRETVLFKDDFKKVDS